MSGRPIEDKLRRMMSHGVGMTRAEVWKHGGAMARGIVERLMRGGDVVLDGDHYRLVSHAPDPMVVAREDAARLARIEQRREVIREQEARLAAAERERVALVRRNAERAELVTQLGAAKSPEQRVKIQESSRLLAWGRQLIASLDTRPRMAVADMERIFGIEIDQPAAERT